MPGLVAVVHSFGVSMVLSLSASSPLVASVVPCTATLTDSDISDKSAELLISLRVAI